MASLKQSELRGRAVLSAERQFTNEFPPPSADERRARRAWLEYYEACETFDRTLPGGWSRRDPDVWMPHPDAYRRMVQFARTRRERVNEELRHLDRDLVERERRAVERLSYSAVREELRIAHLKESERAP